MTSPPRRLHGPARRAGRVCRRAEITGVTLPDVVIPGFAIEPVVVDGEEAGPGIEHEVVTLADATSPTVRREQTWAVETTAGTGDLPTLFRTDDVGDEAANCELSRVRAQAVTDWLVSAEGYRRRHVPVAPNALDDGSNNPEGRAMNRRVVISVVTG